MRIVTIATVILAALCVTGISWAGYSGISETAPLQPCETSLRPARTGSSPCDTSGRGLEKRGNEPEPGFTDLVLGWTAIPRSIVEVTRETKNPLWGLTGGTCKGIGEALTRTIGGAAGVTSPGPGSSKQAQ